MGVLERLVERCGNRVPTCSEQQVRAAEEELGVTLPPLLRSLYLRVGNGGFGPDCRPLRVAGASVAEEDGWVSVVQSARINATSSEDEGDDDAWPPGLLPFCDWGCGMSASVDLASDALRVVRHTPSFPPEALQPDALEDMRDLIAFWPPDRGMTIERQGCYLVEAPSLEGWFELWLAGAPNFSRGPLFRKMAARPRV